MSPLPRIQVYVSYNTVHTEQLTQLEAAFKNYNESDDSGYQMEVKYSENSIDEGDSIVEFMDKIALARFVVLFFSKEYFESPYCLYELIKCYEKQRESKEERFIVSPIKLGSLGAVINTYMVENIIDAWQGRGDLSQSTREKGVDFCQNKLRELLRIENEAIKAKITKVYSDFICPWKDKNLPEITHCQVVQEVEQLVIQVFTEEEKEFNKFILDKIKHELGLIKNLESTWENYSGDSIKKSAIADSLMEGGYATSLSKLQEWTKEEKRTTSPAEWRRFFNRIQKIAGWFVLKSINQDWWINNLLSFTDGAKHHGFVKLGLVKKHFSYSEVVVSKALRKSAQFLLDDENKLIPQVKEFAIREGNDLVFDSCYEANLCTLLLPIVTDLRKTKPQTADANELLEDLLDIASTNTESFFYLVTEDYLAQLQAQNAPNNVGKTVLEVINERLEDKLFFIAVDAKTDEAAPQVTGDFMKAISLMENILLIDK